MKAIDYRLGKRTQYCTKCGKVLQWGEVTYHQKLCWDCFKMDIYLIKDQLPEQEHKDMVHHLMACFAEIHRLNW